MKSLRAFPALAFSTAGLALLAGPAAAANPQIVSRLDGPAGAPFPAELGGLAGDGRYVVLYPSSAAAAQRLGVPQPADPDKLYLRDRTAGTTTELGLRLTPGGPVAAAQFLDISDDASQVLFTTFDPAVRAALGLPEQESSILVVADREGGGLWLVRDTFGEPAVPAGRAVLSADGNAVLALVDAPTGNGPAFSTRIVRDAKDAPAEVVLRRDDTNLSLIGASDDLSSVLYSRTLAPSTRPKYAEITSWSTAALGLVTADGARIIAQGQTVEQKINPLGTCSTGNLELRSSDPHGLTISADGRRVSYVLRKSSISQSPAAELTWQGWNAFVAGPGGVKRETAEGFPGGQYVVWPRTLGATHDVYLDASEKTSGDGSSLDDFGPGYSVRSASNFDLGAGGGGPQNSRFLFADGDQTVVWSSAQQEPFGDQQPPASQPYVQAEAVGTSPLPPSGAGASLWSQGVTDTPELASKVTWAPCLADGDALPIGPAQAYAELQLLSPARASQSAGLVTVRTKPIQYRPVSKVVVETKVFGITTWRKTVTTTSEFALPKPPLYLPMTVKVTATPTGVPSEPSPAPVVLTRTVLATR